MELEADEGRKGRVTHNKPFKRWAQGNRAEAQTTAKGPVCAVHNSIILTAFTTPHFGVICIT